MSDDRNQSEEVVESVEEEQVDALVENEILDEESLEETYGKGKKKVNAMKYNSKEEPVEEEEEDEEEVKEEAPAVEIPKTKAGVIQATVDMLKKAKSEDAKKLYSKLVTIDSEPESIKSEKDAEKAVSGKMPEPKAKAKVEAIDFSDDIDAIIK